MPAGNSGDHRTTRNGRRSRIGFVTARPHGPRSTRPPPPHLTPRTFHSSNPRCTPFSCRSFHLEKLSPGAANWTDEQSQRNFQNVLQHVVPGDPSSSALLIHPLAPEAGGDPFHSGGHQFQSQNDSDWLTIADWVRGTPAG